MRAIIQRVNRASVTVDQTIIAAIERGVLCLVSYAPSDTEEVMQWMAKKIVGMRIFPGESGTDRFDRSVLEIGGKVLIVSNFTLHADCRKGRRPDFVAAAAPDLAVQLHQRFLKLVSDCGVEVHDGRFGAHMLVTSENDGPVTMILEKD